MADETENDLIKNLETIKAKRGYLLPHHGLLQISEPDLLSAYDTFYEVMTLRARNLSELSKEIIWLGILITTGERIATHHLDRLSKAGGGEEHLTECVSLAAWASGAEHYAFVSENWSDFTTDFHAVQNYRVKLDALMIESCLKQGDIEMTLAAIYTATNKHYWLEEHIKGAYASGVEEDQLAEALSLTMFPGGVPNFVDAAQIWKSMINQKKVQASKKYKIWAEMGEQSGFGDVLSHK